MTEIHPEKKQIAQPSLASEQCEACRADSPKVPEQEIPVLLTQLPGWSMQTIDGVMQLTKTFHFRNFAEALRFTNRLGSFAETANHHPAILLEWGHVSVTWWTHKIQGLHRNDFIAAAKTDQLLETNSSL
ncbi:MAG: 4a-hydroxytetrahydrobiopterin dehydratase [Pseudomonadales bacterium]|nr:4a-hydroxytetrahydrobiopterin dehydratase [Pseudomonadales bacterium]MCP5171771.1 4a-hydroxytetrahydrobiopterin dehydratase [Pseudomonadales bacterium]